ncbi:MAG: hypothetical protein U9Q16_00505 [Patescibacteria group bacterium]|nr:hypothetical protein [Patescibacteria group bacterium]
MQKIIRKLVRKLNIVTAFAMALVLTITMGAGAYVLASGTSEFSQTINTGSLATDIVDTGYSSVGSPAVTMNAVTFSFAYQTATGTFGTSAEKIYVKNPDAADNGWTLTVAPANTTDCWDSAGTDFDFNDDGANATDGAAGTNDADALGGQMTVDPSAATLAKGQCSACTITNVSRGSSTAYDEGTTNSVTLLTASAGSDDIGDWTLEAVSISQTIPAEQPAASDYTLSMVLTVAAS